MKHISEVLKETMKEIGEAYLKVQKEKEPIKTKIMNPEYFHD